MATDTAFTMDTSAIKVGPGVTGEIGGDLRGLGCVRVLIVTDSRMADLSPVAVVAGSLGDAGIAAKVYDRVRVEPTDESFKDAIDFAIKGHFDGFVAVGGGSSIDTAKAANLYSTYPDDLLTYVNSPIGKGTPVPGPLKPLIAVFRPPPGPAARRPAWRSSITWKCAPRPASLTARYARPWGSWTRTTPGIYRRWWRRHRRWMS